MRYSEHAGSIWEAEAQQNQTMLAKGAQATPNTAVLGLIPTVLKKGDPGSPEMKP